MVVMQVKGEAQETSKGPGVELLNALFLIIF